MYKRQPYGSRIKVIEGQEIEAGDELTEGSINPHDILKIKVVKGCLVYTSRCVEETGLYPPPALLFARPATPNILKKNAACGIKI